jgi:hypothetical protein
VISDGRSWSYIGTGMYKTVYNVSSLAGNSNVCFRFFAKVASNYGPVSPGYTIDGFSIDDFSISGPTNASNTNSGGVETAIASKTVDLNPNDTTDFFSTNGKLIATVTNLSSTHDYGSTVVEIDQAGGSTSNFDTNTDADQKIFSKTLKITPTTNNGSGVVKIAMYFTNSEFTAWKTATGLWGKDLQMFKTTNAVGSSTIAQGVSPDSAIVDTTYNGNDVCLVGYFSNGFSGVGAGGGAGGGGPLPVEIIDFSGKWLENEVELNWTTATEVNNHFFEIQRATENGEFKPLGKREGAGNSQQLLSYVFYDNQIEPQDLTFYYRIKQVDFDGTSSFTNTIEVKRYEGVVGLFPNPFTNSLMISSKTNRVSTAFLFNLQGKEVAQIEFSSFVSWAVPDVPSGLYLLEIKEGNQTIYTQKLLRQ